MDASLKIQELYDLDFVEWCETTASQLKARNFEQLDLDNLIEEIEGLTKHDRRELRNRLTVLLAHLLKRIYIDSPEKFHGWELTIREQRRQIQDLLQDSPSLKPYFDEVFNTAYQNALDDVCFEYQQTEFPDTWKFDLEPSSLLFKSYWQANSTSLE
ncbi:DUF29 family protein [Synechococcales cyanobacterium C]|uniref:DUF29 family protein n=1 Tax=Petrachloros mirabilis ULC683 TaxID=2781853 RepID=A0A8K1ZYQ7_9CYAN|nr:DUF29 domain-containing protein [Petrachloros mirabilis]NCJ07619.1 DUF29 family protein [Petrachloros mirabilis ULC683]